MALPYNSGTAPTTLCCQCGVPIVWNPQNLCAPCLALLVDIAEDIPKDGMVTWCRTCGRFLNPPNHWMAAALESKELLGLCLKRIRGLNKVRLVDARWIWTEPHSNRLKIELTIQKVKPCMLCWPLHHRPHACYRRCSRTPLFKRALSLTFRSSPFSAMAAVTSPQSTRGRRCCKFGRLQTTSEHFSFSSRCDLLSSFPPSPICPPAP